MRDSNARRDHLAALLSTHTPSSPAEVAHRQAMLELAQVEGDPFHRDHFQPGHYTASAFVLSPDRSALLLIFHGKLHRWLQPGGHFEPEDLDVFAAARREVAEETGIADVSLVGDGLLDVDVHEIPARKGDPAHLHFDARVLFQAGSRDFEAGSDAKDARWVPLAEMDGVESDESVRRAVSRIVGGQAPSGRSSAG